MRTGTMKISPQKVKNWLVEEKTRLHHPRDRGSHFLSTINVPLSSWFHASCSVKHLKKLTHGRWEKCPQH